MKTTTTKLSMDRRARLSYWWHVRGERMVRDGLWGGVMVTMLLLVHSLLKPVEPPLRPIVQQSGAAMLIATPTAGPVVPTATPAPTAAPVVEVQVQTVYVEVPAPPVYVDSYTPPTMPPYEPQPTDAERWANESVPSSEYIDQSIVVESAPAPADVNAKGHSAGPPPEGTQSSGGSGKAPAPDIGDIPASGAAEWCQAAAASGQARCVEGP